MIQSIEELVREKNRRVEDRIYEHFDRHGKDVNVDQLRSKKKALKRVNASEIDAPQKKYADKVSELNDNTERRSVKTLKQILVHVEHVPWMYCVEYTIIL